MRIFVVARAFNQEGAIFEFDQAKALREAGHQVAVIVMDMRSLRHLRLPGIKTLQRDGLTIVKADVPVGIASQSLFNAAGAAAFRKALARACEQLGNPDIIHAHFTTIGNVVAKALDGTQYINRFVLTEHSSRMNKPIEQLDRAMVRAGEYTYPRAARLIAVSTALAEHIQQNFRVDCTVVPNLVNSTIFSMNKNTTGEVPYPQPYKYRKNDSETIFVSTGNLTQNKRMDLLIRAFCRAFPQDDSCRLIISGSGQEQENLARLIDEEGATSRITLLGRMDRVELNKLYAEADAFALLSASETFGVAFIEALMTGLPLLSTSSGGVEDIITDSIGAIIADDIDSAAEGLREMGHRCKTLSPAALSHHAADNFSPGAVAHRLTRIYEEITCPNL